jgi:flavin-dependent dehydrogenase
VSAPDVVVVGAGPWGLATAWRAAEEGGAALVYQVQPVPQVRVTVGADVRSFT